MILASIIGNLGKDAEIKKINEKEYLSFSVASTEKKGEQEVTTWISVLAGNNPNLLPYLKKGQQVFVSGRMSAGIYQSNNSFGIDLSVFASTLQLCGGKREESQQTQQQAPSQSNGITGTTTVSQPGSNGLSTGQTVIYPDREPSPFPPVDDSDSGLPF